jgi:hypothetical protein
MCYRDDIIDSQRSTFEKLKDRIIICTCGNKDIESFNSINGNFFVVLCKTLTNKKINKWYYIR